MQITCEFCGGIIDVKEDKVCPLCGASLENNKQRAKLLAEEQAHKDEKKEMEKQRLRMIQEEAKLRAEGQRLQNQKYMQEVEKLRKEKGKKLLLPIIGKSILALIITAGVVIIFIFGATMKLISEELERMDATTATEAPVPETEPFVETPVEVSFNEVAATSKYSVVCDSVEEYQYYGEPQEGYKHVAMHFVITNLSDEIITSDESLICSYDYNGFLVQAEKPNVPTSVWQLMLEKEKINPNNSVMGNVYFTVPVDADLIVTYGDYVTMNIPASACQPYTGE